MLDSLSGFVIPASVSRSFHESLTNELLAPIANRMEATARAPFPNNSLNTQFAYVLCCFILPPSCRSFYSAKPAPSFIITRLRI
jgi:hypothetical protein